MARPKSIQEATPRQSKTIKRKAGAKRKRRRSSPQQFSADANEAKQIILAIRRGQIDALVMAGKSGDEILTLQGTEHPYRVLVETINDGVATLDRAGVILYANSRFAAIFRVPMRNLIGSSLQNELSVLNRTVNMLVVDPEACVLPAMSLQISGGRPFPSKRGLVFLFYLVDFPLFPRGSIYAWFPAHAVS